MNRRLLILIIAMLAALSGSAQLTAPTASVRFVDPDSIPRPWRALGLSLVPDATVYCVNRFIFHNDFAYLSWHSVKANFTDSPLWDDDLFDTNLLAHPFHGSMDFCGARVSGMNYWQSFPYAFGASAVWELVGENEPAAINDQLATSIGGCVLGEFSLRVSSMIVDNSARGAGRILREVLGTLTCPMNGLNRALTGQMWRHEPRRPDLAIEPTPVWFSLDLLTRQMFRFDLCHANKWQPYLRGELLYGDLFDADNLHPLDWFDARFAIELADRARVLSALRVDGLLWGRSLDLGSERGWQSLWGVFQRYTFSDKGPMGSDEVTTMRYAAPAEVGLGLAMRRESAAGSRFTAMARVDGVLLGAAHATQFRLKKRDYNFGQGYALGLTADYRLHDRLQLTLEGQLVQLFTWRGYRSTRNLLTADYRKINTMGDLGNTLLFLSDFNLHYRLGDHVSLVASASLFMQHNDNHQFPNATYRFADYALGMSYTF